MSLAERIRTARRKSKMSLESFARVAGISKTYLWQLEKDEEGAKRPSAELLLNIASALSIPLTDLMELPSVQEKDNPIAISDSLNSFIKRMQDLKIKLTYGEIRDLATIRFEDSQPRTVDDWHCLYLVLKRTCR